MDFSITGKKFGTTSPAVSIPSKPLTKEKATSVHTTTQAKNGPKPYLHNSSIKPMINRPGNQQSYLPKDNRQKQSKTKILPAEPFKPAKQGEQGHADLQKIEKNAEGEMTVTKKLSEKVVEEIKEEEELWSSVMVRYNHYKEKFPTRNGILSFVPIEDKYSFGDLFRGRFQPVLKNFKTLEVVDPVSTGTAVEFSWLIDESLQYRLQIQEDDEEEAKFEKRVYKAPQPKFVCSCKKNQRAEEISKQLREMKPQDYGTAKYKELIELRDLQDVLFT